jgi:hypothetical protein
VQRRLATLPPESPRLHRKGRPVGPALTRDIPVLRLPWTEMKLGHFEIDLVHHCGPSASGDYGYTLQWIDVATGWSERVAILGRSYRVMKDAFLRILRRLPFPVRELHPDNGSEFFNAHMLSFFGEKVQGARVSRSRPYHKNDNRFVEQKNSSLVRDYLGYDRLDTVVQVLALHQLYDAMWVYYNLFQPVLHLVAKEIVPATADHPAKLRRHHGAARTPFDRLCATGVLAAPRTTGAVARPNQPAPPAPSHLRPDRTRPLSPGRGPRPTGGRRPHPGRVYYFLERRPQPGDIINWRTGTRSVALSFDLTRILLAFSL